MDFWIIKELIKLGVIVLIILFITAISTVYKEYSKTKCSEDFKAIFYNKNENDNEFKLSLVVPCYNESKRLPKMLNSTVEYLNSKELTKNLSIEIIMINDGSRDNTWEVIKSLVDKHKNTNNKHKLIGLTYLKNAGKGHAVRTGMNHSRGDYTLMVDADGATDVNEINTFLNLMNKKVKENGENSSIIIAGSRYHLSENNKVTRNFSRKFVSLVNSFFVHSLIGIKNIRDTQCGFKMFTRSANKYLANKMHLNRWAFDIELFYIAQRNNFIIEEIGINWREIEGGNLNILSASISFFRDYFGILTFYTLGIWKK